jgi:hypothetical protein
MRKPLIHLNGTSAATLLNLYSEASLDLTRGLNALYAAAPNARDYYHEPGAYNEARREHQDRVERVQSVIQELAELTEHVLGY